jgi:hypothetical protein
MKYPSVILTVFEPLLERGDATYGKRARSIYQSIFVIHTHCTYPPYPLVACYLAMGYRPVGYYGFFLAYPVAWLLGRSGYKLDDRLDSLLIHHRHLDFSPLMEDMCYIIHTYRHTYI